MSDAAGAITVDSRTPRVMLFTDTLGDVNGVARFIRNLAKVASDAASPLLVAASTSLPVPDLATIRNFAPVVDVPMPAYPQLRLTLPPVRAMLAAAAAFEPEAIHVSTPGPVGLTGVLAAKRLGLPLVGVYHTDFPAYLERILGDESLGRLTTWAMGCLYRRFSRVLTRNAEYERSLLGLGVAGDRIGRLAAGFRVQEFSPRRCDRAWMAAECGSSSAATVRVLYVGRVSVEKNLAMLSRVWRRVDASLRVKGLDAQLVIVGDGPARAALELELKGTRHAMLGFRHGEELATCYASCDLFVFPSTTDTLGQVVLEAQASGLGAIVTDEGGPQHLIRDGETGLRLAASDEAAWATAIEALATDAPRRRVLGEAAAASVARHAMEPCFAAFMEEHRRAIQTHSVRFPCGNRGSLP